MWEPKDISEEDINHGEQITENSTVNKDLFNTIVALLLYLKEV